jgi:GDPmannose 4,6-dehydratase
MNIAFITGANGQDGSYLIEFLLNKNYIIYGLVRRNSVLDFPRLENIRNNPNLYLHYAFKSDLLRL